MHVDVCITSGSPRHILGLKHLSHAAGWRYGRIVTVGCASANTKVPLLAWAATYVCMVVVLCWGWRQQRQLAAGQGTAYAAAKAGLTGLTKDACTLLRA